MRKVKLVARFACVTILVFSSLTLLTACDLFDGGKLHSVETYIKNNPNSQSKSDKYCTVTYGGDGGTYETNFLVENKSNERREIKVEFRLENWKKNLYKSSEVAHSENHTGTIRLGPGETGVLTVPWQKWGHIDSKGHASDSYEIRIGEHSTEIKNISSSVISK